MDEKVAKKTHKVAQEAISKTESYDTTEELSSYVAQTPEKEVQDEGSTKN